MGDCQPAERAGTAAIHPVPAKPGRNAPTGVPRRSQCSTIEPSANPASHSPPGWQRQASSPQRLTQPRDYAAAIWPSPARSVALRWKPAGQLAATCSGTRRGRLREVKAYRRMMDHRAESGPARPASPRVTGTGFRISNYTKSAPSGQCAHLSAIRALATEACKYLIRIPPRPAAPRC